MVDIFLAPVDLVLFRCFCVFVLIAISLLSLSGLLSNKFPLPANAAHWDAWFKKSDTKKPLMQLAPINGRNDECRGHMNKKKWIILKFPMRHFYVYVLFIHTERKGNSYNLCIHFKRLGMQVKFKLVGPYSYPYLFFHVGSALDTGRLKTMGQH